MLRKIDRAALPLHVGGVHEFIQALSIFSSKGQKEDKLKFAFRVYSPRSPWAMYKRVCASIRASCAHACIQTDAYAHVYADGYTCAHVWIVKYSGQSFAYTHTCCSKAHTLVPASMQHIQSMRMHTAWVAMFKVCACGAGMHTKAPGQGSLVESSI